MSTTEDRGDLTPGSSSGTRSQVASPTLRVGILFLVSAILGSCAAQAPGPAGEPPASDDSFVTVIVHNPKPGPQVVYAWWGPTSTGILLGTVGGRQVRTFTTAYHGPELTITGSSVSTSPRRQRPPRQFGSIHPGGTVRALLGVGQSQEF